MAAYCCLTIGRSRRHAIREPLVGEPGGQLLHLQWQINRSSTQYLGYDQRERSFLAGCRPRANHRDCVASLPDRSVQARCLIIPCPD